MTTTTVRQTESRLPDGFTAQDLGQASVFGDYALVSYLTSPIPVGSTVDYVVFAQHGAPADEYRWRLYSPSAERSPRDETGESTLSHTADVLGELHVIVEVIAEGRTVAELPLMQEVVPLDQALEFLLDPAAMAAAGSAGAFGGDRKASRELVNDFGRYIRAAVKNRDVSIGLLAATAYFEIGRVPKKSALGLLAVHRSRAAELAAAGAELNGDFFAAPGTQVENALGVCQITAQTLAMLLPKPDVPHITWTEKPAEPRDRKAVSETILNAYRGLSAECRTDLFNLLRFPKTNIHMCARLLDRLKNRDHRWKGVSQESFLREENAPELLATEFKVGATITPKASARANDDGKQIREIMAAPFISVPFPDVTATGASDYGARDLKRDQTGPEVRKLGEALLALGFGILGTPSETFDRNVEAAVREFQIYAGMRYIARQTASAAPGAYLSTLTQAANALPYSGPVSGVANRATRVRTRHWLDHGFRCPVIIGAFDTGGKVWGGNDNIWAHDKVQTEGPTARMFVRDLSEYYHWDTQPERVSRDLIKVGEWNDAGGPISWPPHHTWPEAEMMPLALAGQTLESMDASSRATYRVVRAVSEVECSAFFDCINAWDTAVISVGACHWTLRGGLELGAYLTYLRHADPLVYWTAVGRFGVGTAKRWTARKNGVPVADGADLFEAKERKYRSQFTRQAGEGEYELVPTALAESNYYRNWHWVYRFAMAGRTLEGFRRRMWDMARIRLRDLLGVPFPAGAGAAAGLRIGDVFTSEKAVALLYRWHIIYPPDVCSNGVAGPRVQGAVTTAGIPTGTDEKQLVDAIVAQVENVDDANRKTSLTDTFKWVTTWPNYTGRANRGFQLGSSTAPLSSDRNSFALDGRGLPPQP